MKTHRHLLISHQAPKVILSFILAISSISFASSSWALESLTHNSVTDHSAFRFLSHYLTHYGKRTLEYAKKEPKNAIILAALIGLAIKKRKNVYGAIKGLFNPERQFRAHQDDHLDTIIAKIRQAQDPKKEAIEAFKNIFLKIIPTLEAMEKNQAEQFMKDLAQELSVILNQKIKVPLKELQGQFDPKPLALGNG